MRQRLAHIWSHRPRLWTALALACGFLVLSAGCSKTLNVEGVASAVKEGLQSQIDLAVDSVTCPDSREAKAGDTFECTAVPQGGGRLVVKVIQNDDQGAIRWEVVKTEGLLDLIKLEEQIKTGLKEQASVEATVSCGGKFRPAEAGKQFDCTATDSQNTAMPVTVTMEDTEGHVTWRLNQQ